MLITNECSETGPVTGTIHRIKQQKNKEEMR